MLQQSGITNWFSDVHLVSEYVFMEDNARNEFANNCQSMLIRTIHEYDVYDLFGQQSTVLKSNGLVINWMWFFQRSDVGKRNQWTNYTNREYIDEIKTGIFQSIDHWTKKKEIKKWDVKLDKNSYFIIFSEHFSSHLMT